MIKFLRYVVLQMIESSCGMLFYGQPFGGTPILADDGPRTARACGVKRCEIRLHPEFRHVVTVDRVAGVAAKEALSIAVVRTAPHKMTK